MTQPDFDEIARRPARYWHIDGFPELMVGLLWVVWGAAWLFGQALPHDWRWNAYWLIMPAVLACSGFLLQRTTMWLKSRVTYPRTGYVAFKEPSAPVRAVVAAFVILAAVLLAYMVFTTDATLEQRMPAVFGVLLSLALIVIAVQQHTPHHFVLAAAALVLTLVTARATSGWNAMNWLLVTLGAATALVGAVRLALFLRAHPREAEGL